MSDVTSPDKIKPALIAGLVFGIASGLPVIGWLNCACCALVAASGFLAAYLYQKDSPFPIQFGDGAVLGLWTGLSGGVIDTLVSLPFSLLSFAAFDAREVSRALEEANLPPDVQRLSEMILAQEALIGGTLVATLFINIILWLIFATIGAILGVAVFQKTGGTMSGPPPPQATPPPPPPTPIE